MVFGAQQDRKQVEVVLIFLPAGDRPLGVGSPSRGVGVRSSRMRRLSFRVSGVQTEMKFATLIVGFVVFCLVSIQAGDSAVMSIPRTRTYSGRVVGGTGAYVKATGKMAVSLALTQSGEVSDPPYGPRPKYAVMITLRGAKCRSTRLYHRRRACLSLMGTLSGEALTDPDIIGDDPTVIRITASPGRLARLGVVKATGTFEGTGFVPKGNRSLRLTLVVPKGNVFISAEGPPVPGFTSP